MSTQPGVTEEPARVDLAPRGAGGVADRGDAVAVDRDVADAARGARAVDDRPAADHEIVHGAGTLHPAGRREGHEARDAPHPLGVVRAARQHAAVEHRGLLTKTNISVTVSGPTTLHHHAGSAASPDRKSPHQKRTSPK